MEAIVSQFATRSLELTFFGQTRVKMSTSSSIEKRSTLSKNPFIATVEGFPSNVHLTFESHVQRKDEMLQAQALPNRKYEEEDKALKEIFSSNEEEAIDRRSEEEEVPARRIEENEATRIILEDEELNARKLEEEEALVKTKEEEATLQEKKATARRLIEEARLEEEQVIARKLEGEALAKRKEEEALVRRLEEEAVASIVRKRKEEEASAKIKEKEEALARRFEEEEALATRLKEESAAIAQRKEEEKALVRRTEEEEEAIARRKEEEDTKAVEEAEMRLAFRKDLKLEVDQILRDTNETMKERKRHLERGDKRERRGELKERKGGAVDEHTRRVVAEKENTSQPDMEYADAEKLRRRMEAAEARVALIRRTHMTPVRKNMAIVLNSFKSVSIALSSILCEDAELMSSLQKLRRRPVIINKHALVQQLPNISLTFMGRTLEDFGKLFTNLQSKSNINVFDVEFSKRVVLYNALQTMSRKTGSMYASLLQLLFMLSTKTFVIAFYAATQGCICHPLSKMSIFDARPSIGTDVSDIFRDQLGELYRKGCTELNLSRSFVDKLRHDCVSMYELKFLVSIFS